MFKVGSRVRVADSSLSSGPGPRKGSIGYMGSIKDAFVLKDDGDGRYTAALVMELYFCRYGFEEKSRKERKIVTALFPASVAREDISNEIFLLRNKMHGKCGERWYQQLRGRCPWSPGSMVILAPAAESSDLLTCGKSELGCWLESTLRDRAFLRFVNEGLSSRHLVTEERPTHLLPGVVALIRDIAMDRDRRIDVHDSIMYSHGYRSEVVKGISAIHACMASYQSTARSDIRKHIERGDYSHKSDNTYANLALVLTAYLFFPPLYEVAKKAMLDFVPTRKFKHLFEEQETLKAEVMGLF